MEALFIWLETTWLSQWVRAETGATMAFPAIISVHAIGMGFLAGIASMLNLRVLGVAPNVPLGRLIAFMPVLWAALLLNVISGLLLLLAYPTKALTNPVFYAKLLCIASALWGLFYVRKHVLLQTQPVLTSRDRVVASLSTVLWVVAIVTGRLLAYTHTQLLSR